MNPDLEVDAINAILEIVAIPEAIPGTGTPSGIIVTVTREEILEAIHAILDRTVIAILVILEAIHAILGIVIQETRAIVEVVLEDMRSHLYPMYPDSHPRFPQLWLPLIRTKPNLSCK